MIAHISIGVRGIERSRRFYDAALEPLGYKYLRAARTLLGYGYGRDSIALWVVQAEHRFQPTKSRVCTFVLPQRTPLPFMRFTRRRCALAGMTMVRPVCARYTALITTLPSSSIRTDTGSRRITVQPKPEVSPIKMTHSPWLPSSPKRHYPPGSPRSGCRSDFQAIHVQRSCDQNQSDYRRLIRCPKHDQLEDSSSSCCAETCLSRSAVVWEQLRQRREARERLVAI